MPQSPISPQPLSAEALPVRAGGVMNAEFSHVGGMSPFLSTTTLLRTPDCPVAVVDAMAATPWRWDDGEIAHLLARRGITGRGGGGTGNRSPTRSHSFRDVDGSGRYSKWAFLRKATARKTTCAFLTYRERRDTECEISLGLSTGRRICSNRGSASGSRAEGRVGVDMPAPRAAFDIANLTQDVA